MPSRKTFLLGAGALVLVVLVVVVLTRGGDPSFSVERGDTSEFPLRGSLADDQGAIEDAIEAWKDGRGVSDDEARAARVSDADVHVLYAGKLADESVVVIRQVDRAIPIFRSADGDWSVRGATIGFDPVDGAPLDLNDIILLPAGDWTWLPLTHDPSPPRTFDGLIDGGSELKPGFAVEKGTTNELGKLYDVDGGLFRVDDENYDRIIAASQQPGRLLAIHAGLTGDEDEDPRLQGNVRTVDVLWTGKLPGVPQAAIVSRARPDRLGLGLVDDPDGFASGAASLSLGSSGNPLAARTNGVEDEPLVGATYVVDDDNRPQTLVAAATGAVDRLEFLVGDRSFTRPGPVALVPVDWDTETTDAVVVGRDKRGAVIAPLSP